MRGLLFLGVFGLLGAVTYSCKLKRDELSSRVKAGPPSASAEQLSREAYISKLSRVLRNGLSVTSADELQRLLKMTDQEIVAEFMNDPRFGSTVLGFNLYYLGRSFNDLERIDNAGKITYNNLVFDIPNAVASAKHVVDGGDYFDLFSIKPPYYAPAGTGATPPREGDGSAVTVTDGEASSGGTWLTQMPRALEKNGLSALTTPTVEDVPLENRTMLSFNNFWGPLPNSSTNYNRKRAAYVLKTFFCDDLSSENISIEEMKEHKGSHGSNPTCLSCHYKLDPIGALFRFHGRAGMNFKDQPNLVFDDGKNIEGKAKEAYLAEWLDSSKRLQVGYYVGVGKPHRRWRGDSLEDLFAFLKVAPEAKRCLVKRMAQYYVGTSHAYDEEWLEEVSASLVPGPKSGEAFKATVAQLVTSRTFKTSDPEKGKCYDFPASAASKVRPDCEVNYILNQACTSCHASADEGSGINLTEFIAVPRSKDSADTVYGFPHRVDGRQLSRQESFAMIIDRILTNDKQKKMPRGGSLNEEDRRFLVKWLNSKMNDAR